MATDRALFKAQSVGTLSSIASSNANALATVSAESTRAYMWTKFGAENSSNNVVETVMFVVNRPGVVKSIKVVTNTAVSANATNGMVMVVAKHTVANVNAAVPLGTWNTDTNTLAQGALVAWSPASFPVVTSSDSSVLAGDVLTFKCTKFGSGSLLDGGAAVVVDVEES